MVLNPSNLASLIGAAFLGAEALILLGFQDATTRQALRSVGGLIKTMEGNDR